MFQVYIYLLFFIVSIFFFLIVFENRAYEKWKRIAPDMSNEETEKRNRESFEHYTINKDKIREKAKALWGEI